MECDVEEYIKKGMDVYEKVFAEIPFDSSYRYVLVTGEDEELVDAFRRYVPELSQRTKVVVFVDQDRDSEGFEPAEVYPLKYEELDCMRGYLGMLAQRRGRDSGFPFVNLSEGKSIGASVTDLVKNGEVTYDEYVRNGLFWFYYYE